MSLTRKMLKGMGLTEEQADTIIEAHSETVDGLKEKLSAAEDKAKNAEATQAELDKLKAKGGIDYEAKFNKEHSDFEAFKKSVADKETQAAREKAAKAFFEEKNITGANLSIAMRGARDEIAALELDSNGAIKDAKSLEALVSGEFSGLVVTSSTRGVQTSTPPNNTGGKMTKEDILKIKDTSARQKAIAENIELFKR